MTGEAVVGQDRPDIAVEINQTLIVASTGSDDNTSNRMSSEIGATRLAVIRMFRTLMSRPVQADSLSSFCCLRW